MSSLEMKVERVGTMPLAALLDMAVRLPAAIVISSGGTCGYGDNGIRYW